VGDPSTRTSVWALPDAGSDAWFRRTIASFAARGGTAPFRPHVTVCGATPAAFTRDDVAAALAGAARFDVAFTRVDDEPVRYRCVTLRADAEPMSALRERLRPVVHDEGNDPYRPHLSLFYGDLDADARRALIEAAALPTVLPVATIDAVALWDTTADSWDEWFELDRWPLVG
jgi:hypothetical protein